MNKKHSNSKAFVLLYALLVAGIVLAIGLSLSSIISKQIILSSVGKMSRVAYYAADAGRDCAFFWAVKYGPTVSTGINPDSPSTSRIYCQNDNAENPMLISPSDESTEKQLSIDLLAMYGISLNSTDYVHFYFSQDLDVDSKLACNKVSVFVSKNITNSISSVIVSRGFSASCGTVNPRTVGRSVINVVEKGT